MYLSSWSGGKDSCFACYRAIKNGIRISRLIHFVRENDLHGIEPSLVKLQAELTGIPIVQKKVLSDNFELEFKETIGSLLKNGTKGMVFGDIYLKEHKDWVERVCGELGLESLEPLWEISTEKLLSDFIDQGFRSVVVSAKRDLIDKEWIGRLVDRNFMEYLKGNKLDVCGENGEFHTFVVAGPLFKGMIDLLRTKIISKNDNWFLDIKDYRVVR